MGGQRVDAYVHAAQMRHERRDIMSHDSPILWIRRKHEAVCFFAMLDDEKVAAKSGVG